MRQQNRRAFLADIGCGMLTASVGSSLAVDMGLSRAWGNEASSVLTFGELEPLAALMQETPADKLLPLLAERVKNGTELRTLIAAGSLANARAFGGEDYIGFHTFMALAPALEMSRELPTDMQPLPVFKVLHRNATRIQAHGGRKGEVLHHVEPGTLPTDRAAGEQLQEQVRRRDVNGAEKTFAALAKGPLGEAYQHLQYEVQDEVDVHRVVLSWRAWSMLDVTGKEYAHTLLRQSVRFCVQQEGYYIDHKRPLPEIRVLLPKLFDEHKLLSKSLGSRDPGDAWVAEFSQLVYSAPRAKAAQAVAAALAEGIAPDVIGEAISLAANQLVLRDMGRSQAAGGDKVPGTTHGDSVGVHASDSANAWRNIARVSNPRNVVASLIVGAYHTAGQAGGQSKENFPNSEHLAQVTMRDPVKLLGELVEAVRGKDQHRAMAVASRYAEAQGDARAIFDTLLRFATSEDGALHAEKYYRTASEEFANTRSAFRWRQVAALARVSASEFGTPSPGYVQAKELFKV